MIQWGQINANQNEDKAVSFIKMFNSSNIQVVAQQGTETGENSTYYNGIQIHTISRSQFYTRTAMAASIVRYIAIGY